MVSVRSVERGERQSVRALEREERNGVGVGEENEVKDKESIQNESS